MKTTKLKITNLFGIKSLELSGQSMELTGENGTGKTSVIDAIRYAFSNKSGRDYIVREGAEEGEVLIETDTGLRINRKSRVNGADYRSIKQNGKDVQGPETFLRELYTELQFNPIEFIGMSKSEQNRIILDMIDFKWDKNWIIEQFGELVPDVNYEQNILCVLHDIQADEGYYFKERQDLNREARNKQAFIAEIGQELPPKYDAEKWRAANSGEIHEKVERIRNKNDEITKAKNLVESRDDKVGKFEAKYKVKLSDIKKEAGELKKTQEDSIVVHCQKIKDLEQEIKDGKREIEEIERRTLDKLTMATKTHEADIAEFEGEVKQFKDLAKEEPKSFDDLKAEAENIEKMKAHINEYDRMVGFQGDVGVLREDAEELTGKIEHARALPGEILEKSNVPIEGLTIKDGIPLINGLPISNLSDGEKIIFCANVVVQNPNALQMLLLDGMEKLSTQNREEFYKTLRSKGIRYIATRTTNENELMVGEL